MLYPGGLFRLLLLLAFLSAGSLSWCQQEAEPLPPSPSQSETISQLKDNLTQALALSLNLQQRLQLRIASFNSLLLDYTELEAKLAQLQKTLDDSVIALEQARSDLETTKRLLSSLEESLKQASKSLADYKAATEAAVKAVEMQRSAWKVAGIAFGIVAVIEGTMLIFQAVRK